ncbi:MAG: hypothetical protein LBV46_04520, partial [Bacteroidales bacterium]|nr:hypothetical protein [Bacteroidales bacterium]
IKADLASTATLYPLTEKFRDDFLHQASLYEGEHSRIAAEMPARWGLLCVERLPEGREMWMIQSESREWIFLVITSGLGTQRIIDLVPIALNLSVQNRDILETEIWTTHREADGSFTVSKHYEWVRSVGDADRKEVAAHPENWQKSEDFTDHYTVNSLCRFDYQKIEMVKYNALFFFYNPQNKPQDWDEIVPVLEAYCEENNIFYDEISNPYNQVIVRNFMFKDLDTLNLSTLIADTQEGMVMIIAGEPPRKVTYGSYEKLKVEIKRFFKLLSQQ